MNSNKNQTNYNNESNSITMNLENLRKQYSNILIQYKQSVTDYINYLNQNTKTTTAPTTKIRFAGNEWFNISQILIQDTNNNTIKPITINHPGTWGGALEPIGMFDGSYRARSFPQIYHTNTNSNVTIDIIINPTQIGKITIYNRSYCCSSRIASFTLSLLDINNNTIETKPLSDLQIQTIDFNASRQSGQSFVNMKGQSYLGTGTLQQINNTNLNNCQALCGNNSKCSGATFQSNTCILKTGDSQIIPSSNDSYAIIPEGKRLLMNMENLNQELININKKISNKLNKLEPYFNDNNVDKKNNTIELIQNYKKLMEERKNILKLLNDYKTLDNKQNEYEIKITQNYYFYILYFILIIIILYLLYKISYPSSLNNIKYDGELGINAYYIVFFIIIIVIILRYLLFIYI